MEKLFKTNTINLTEEWAQYAGHPSKHLYVNSLGQIEVKCYSAKVWHIFGGNDLKKAKELYYSIKPTPFKRIQITTTTP